MNINQELQLTAVAVVANCHVGFTSKSISATHVAKR